jgi:tetratricopeptide (TPR) repeat protein
VVILKPQTLRFKHKIIGLCVLLTACNASHKQKITAKALNDSVLVLTENYKDTSQYGNAFALLEQARKIDSNYFDTYSNKLFLEESLDQFDKAAKTLTKMLSLKRDSADLYLKAGIYSEVRGDTVAAKINFNRALPRYTILLDTMSSKHPERHNTLNMLAINIIMLGQESMLHDFLQENCKTALDSVFMSANVLGKSKEELLKRLRIRYNR